MVLLFEHKKYKSGKYKVYIKASDSKSNIYKKYTNFTVDNIPPKVISVKSSAKSVVAGRHFSIVSIADSTSEKVIAKLKEINTILNLMVMLMIRSLKIIKIGL